MILTVQHYFPTDRPYRVGMTWNQRCWFCLNDFLNTDMIALFPCKHAVHRACFSVWEGAFKCPLDQTLLYEGTRVSFLGSSILIPYKDKDFVTFFTHYIEARWDNFRHNREEVESLSTFLQIHSLKGKAIVNVVALILEDFMLACHENPEEEEIKLSIQVLLDGLIRVLESHSESIEMVSWLYDIILCDFFQSARNQEGVEFFDEEVDDTARQYQHHFIDLFKKHPKHILHLRQKNGVFFSFHREQLAKRSSCCAKYGYLYRLGFRNFHLLTQLHPVVEPLDETSQLIHRASKICGVALGVFVVIGVLSIAFTVYYIRR